MNYYGYSGDGYGPGVNDVDVTTVLICEADDCNFDDRIDAVQSGNIVTGECPKCGLYFEEDRG